MKRITTLFSLVLGAAVMMTGCGFNSQFKDEPNLTEKSGIIVEQAKSDTRPGTHILVTESGEEILVRSLNMNLSKEDYLNNSVELTGVTADDEVLEVTSVKVLEVKKKSEGGADFVDYKNTDFGIELKYYSDWDLDEGGSSITFTSPADEGASISDWVEIEQKAFTYSPSLDESGEEVPALKEYFDSNFAELDNYNAYVNKVGKDAVDALKFDNGDDGVEYYFYRSGLIYKASFNPSRNYDSNNLKTFNEMMAEFRFLGFTVNEGSGQETDLSEVKKAEEALETKGSIADIDEPESEDDAEVPELNIKLTTFESLPYAFRASYPASWYYSGSRGSEPGVLHHYGFSDEADSTDLLSLNVIKDSSVAEGEISKVKAGNTLKVYTKIDGQAYEVSGPLKYEDLLVVMAASIKHIDLD